MQAVDLEYVGFWPRVGATVIDTVLIMFFTAPFLVAIYGFAYYTDPSKPMIAGPADFLISWILPALAVIAFWLLKRATPGKMAIGAQVVDARTGGRLSAGQAVVRYLAYFVAIVPLFLGIVWVAFDPRKQGWHDRLAGTVVVRPKHRGPEPVRFGAN